METKHTPGPWKVLENGIESIIGRFENKNEEGEWIGCRVISLEICGSKTAEANARLIAAAPDLLAALQELNASFDYSVPSERNRAKWQNEAREQASAAIAKATQP